MERSVPAAVLRPNKPLSKLRNYVARGARLGASKMFGRLVRRFAGRMPRHDAVVAPLYVISHMMRWLFADVVHGANVAPLVQVAIVAP
jgi:hypothetical protein